MEIDFLGLISKQSQKLEKGRRKNTFKDSAIRGADISLSLSTTISSVDFKGETLSFGENNGWPVPINKMIPTCDGSLEKAHTREKSSRAFVQTPINKLSSTTGFPYDLNEKPTDLRNIFEPTAQPAFLTILHSGATHVFHESLPDKQQQVFLSYFYCRKMHKGLLLYSNGGNGSEGNLGQIFGEAHASIDTYKDTKPYQKITRCNQFSNLECKYKVQQEEHYYQVVIRKGSLRWKLTRGLSNRNRKQDGEALNSINEFLLSFEAEQA